MHGVVKTIKPDKCDPEVKLTEPLVQHAPRDLGIPVIHRAKNGENRRHRHHHVKVGNDKVGVGQRHIHNHVAQKDASQPTVDKRKHKADGKQHRHCQADIATPQRQHPVVDLDRRGHRNNQCCGREEKPEVRVHTTHIHVMRPDNETQTTDDYDGPDHQTVAKDVLTGMNTEQFGHDAKSWQSDDIDLRVTKKPEQMLEQDGAATGIIQLLSQRNDGRHEVAGAEQIIQAHHDGADQERRKSQQRQHCGGEDCPDGQRHTHQRHASCTRLQDCDHIVQATHGEANDKKCQRNNHQCNAPTRPWRPGQDRLRRIQGPARTGWPPRHKETGE